MNINGIKLKAAMIAHDTQDILSLIEDDDMQARVTSEANKFIETKHPAANGATFDQVLAIFREAFDVRLDEVLAAAIVSHKTASEAGDDDSMDDFADMMKGLGLYD